MSNTSKLLTAASFKEQFQAMFTPTVDLSGIEWNDMEMAIGQNADKYRPLWDRIQSGKKGLLANFSPCWSAIPFLGVSWAVARRLYGMALVLFVVLNAFNFAFPSEDGAARILGIAILCSFTVKRSYLCWLSNGIRRINAQGLAGAEREAALRQLGGLDQKSGWIAAGAMVAIAIVLACVLG